MELAKSDSRTNPFQPGGTDVEIDMSDIIRQVHDPMIRINRPMTRSQKRKMDANISTLIRESLDREFLEPLSFKYINYTYINLNDEVVTN